MGSGRNYWKPSLTTLNPTGWERRPRSFHFSQETLWYGLPENEPKLCNGLIRDWVSWQNQWMRDDALHQATPESSPFVVLRSLIEHFTPPFKELIEIGSPIRIHPDDVKDYPTLTMSYGDVPLVHASAGMKRVVSLAYLLTWAWDEHKRASRLRNQEPVEHMVLLIDEVESHLHPRWQRTLLPSILDVGKAAQGLCRFADPRYDSLALGSGINRASFGCSSFGYRHFHAARGNSIGWSVRI